MKVLILGGTGMLGSPHGLEFLRGGHEVHSVSSRARIDAEFDKGVHQHALNLSDAGALAIPSLLILKLVGLNGRKR
ncbi:hypothetical protein CTI14_51690 [Methylobacterium radiotolerans]|nr:hypothetical protein CTI14_51690 [Methylobacterium radiotolerans]